MTLASLELGKNLHLINMINKEICEWSIDGVLDEITSIHSKMKDRQFAFILGAGASYKSGIPTGKDLALQWIKQLHLRESLDDTPLEEWVKKCGIGEGRITLDSVAEYYPNIFERRFHGDREAGYAELEAAMEGKSPSLGYSLLAEIIQKTRNKVVVTTNFDNLVADALAMHAHQSPLVVAHESLAGFVRPQLRRPLIAKIHRDLFLQPFNDTDRVSQLEASWTIALKKLFQHFTPIVIGYGGNDGSLMNMLEGLESGDISGRLIWCHRGNYNLPEKVQSVLRKHEGILVKIEGFDEFMLQLADKLIENFDVSEIAERTAKLGEERAEHYRNQTAELQKSLLAETPAKQKVSAAIQNTIDAAKNWWSWELKARSTNNLKERDQIYREGITNFPDSAPLIGNYANFLADESRDYTAAEIMYQRALHHSPHNLNAICNYAYFLAKANKDYDSAEQLFKKAIALDPNRTNTLGGYADFLAEHRKNLDAAESLYKKALEIDPTSSKVLGNYANFLHRHRNDSDASEAMYKKSLHINPDDPHVKANYAGFLFVQDRDKDTVEKLYNEALQLRPNDATIQGNYALFLTRYDRDPDITEAFFKRALELTPNDAQILANYAQFLFQRRNDYNAAAEFYKKSLDSDPNIATTLSSYAIFLDSQGADSKKIQELFEKSLNIDPDNTMILSAYAGYVSKRLKDYAQAEVMYKKTVELAPNDSNTLANYASFLLIKNSEISLNAASALLERILQLCQPVVTQSLAESLFYGALLQKLGINTHTKDMLGRLKSVLKIGYARGHWDFSLVLESILPKIEKKDQEFFKAISNAILNKEDALNLEKHDKWRDITPIPIFKDIPNLAPIESPT